MPGSRGLQAYCFKKSRALSDLAKPERKIELCSLAPKALTQGTKGQGLIRELGLKQLITRRWILREHCLGTTTMLPESTGVRQNAARQGLSTKQAPRYEGDCVREIGCRIAAFCLAANALAISSGQQAPSQADHAAK